MLISVISKGITYEGSTGISDDEAPYVNKINRKWLKGEIVQSGKGVYVRTGEDFLPPVFTTIGKYELGDPVYISTGLNYIDKVIGTGGYILKPLLKIEDTSWGWTYKQPVDTHAPLDKLRYTSVSSLDQMTYTVSTQDLIDTVAVSGLVASKIIVTFMPTDGSPQIDPIGVDIDGRQDPEGRLPQLPVTAIIYSPRDFIGDVLINLLPFPKEDGKEIAFSEVNLGLSVDAGFTNLKFSNKFKDYSPYEKDQWGNITYIEGVKSNIFLGVVDVNLKQYDMMNRLMANIGGTSVIFNGSDDRENNSVEDSKNFFASTKVVGRIKNFLLQTKLEDRRLSQLATYTFEIEEDI